MAIAGLEDSVVLDSKMGTLNLMFDHHFPFQDGHAEGARPMLFSGSNGICACSDGISRQIPYRNQTRQWEIPELSGGV